MIVELPDGTELELPEGTSAQQAQAAARNYLARVSKGSGGPQAAPVGGSPAQAVQGPVEGSGGAAFGLFPKSGKGRQYEPDKLEKMRTGVANAGIEAYLGGKQLIKDLSPEELDVLRQSRGDVKENGGWAGVGRFLGNAGVSTAASILTPQAALTKALSSLGVAAPAVNAAIQSGVQSAAFTPVEDQENKYADKAKEGGKAAAAGAAFTAGGQVLKKAATKMFTPTPDAIQLMDQGVYPTLQQGAESRVGQVIGGLASGSKAVPRRQAQEVLDAVTDRATGGRVNMPASTLNERVGVVNDVLDQDYNQLLGNKRFPMTKSIKEGAIQDARSIANGGQFQNEADEAENILRNVFGPRTNGQRLGHEKLVKNYINAIQQQIGGNTPAKLEEALVNAKNSIVQNSRNSQLSPDELALLKDVDSRYFDLQRLRDAAKGATGHEFGVPIRKLADAYARGPGMDQIGATNATNAELIGPAYRTLGKTESENAARGTLLNARRAFGLGTLGAGAAATGTVAPLAAVLAPLYGTSIAGQTKGGARFLFGDYDWQKSLKGALESPQTNQISLANMIRAIRDNSAGYGAALTPGE